MSTHETGAFIHMSDKTDHNKGTLYVSDNTGITFTVSLQNHLVYIYIVIVIVIVIVVVVVIVIVIVISSSLYLYWVLILVFMISMRLIVYVVPT